jgi:hypothetical protein
MLPLATATRRGVYAWGIPAPVRGLDDVDKSHTCPRPFVLDDRRGDHFSRHRSGDEMGFPILAGDGLAAVCHVVGMKLDHGSSVPLVDVSTDCVGCIVAWCLHDARGPMNINTILRFHEQWFYVAVLTTGLVGAWGLILAVMKREPSRWFGYARAVAITAMLIQIGAGVILYSNDLRPGNSFHIFYGVVIAVTLTLAYLYRSAMAKRPALTYGILLLFVMGLGLRAWANVS